MSRSNASDVGTKKATPRFRDVAFVLFSEQTHYVFPCKGIDDALHVHFSLMDIDDFQRLPVHRLADFQVCLFRLFCLMPI